MGLGDSAISSSAGSSGGAGSKTSSGGVTGAGGEGFVQAFSGASSRRNASAMHSAFVALLIETYHLGGQNLRLFVRRIIAQKLVQDPVINFFRVAFEITLQHRGLVLVYDLSLIHI